MRPVLVFLISALLLAGVMALNACPMNHYLQILSNKGLGLKSTPLNTTLICAKEFGTHGTCCDEYNLLNKAKDDDRDVGIAVKRVIEEFEHFNGFLFNYARRIKELAFLPEKKCDWAGNHRNQTIRKAKAFINQETTKQMFKQLKPFNKTEVDIFANSTKKCWNHMMHARNASLCFTCSGRSHVFFNKGLAKVDLGQCENIMNDCHTSLKMTMEFIRQYKDLAEVN